MNSINDILNQKADELFDDPLKDLTATQTDKPPQDQKTDGNNSDNRQLDVKQIKNSIYRIKDQFDGLLRLLDGQTAPTQTDSKQQESDLETGEKIIEGVFNGEKMVDSEGKEYGVPANYASKSKLVEGDLMKLTITKNGSFIYKQIGPVERRRVTGELLFNADTNQYSVVAEGKNYKVLTASITFFKGRAGDEVVLVLPKDSPSSWGAVDNIIKR